MLSNTSYLFLSWLHQNWKLNIVIIEIVAKRKELITLMSAKPKTLSKRQKEQFLFFFMFNFSKLQVRKQVPSKVKLENGYNHAMLIIRKSDLLLNWSGSSIISWHLVPLYGM